VSRLASWLRRRLRRLWRARAGVAIGEIEAWDDQGRLLAFATQAMHLKTVNGEPPVVDASRR
ncbi:MAG TPA: hypothetical protein PKU97_24775, partial [Kofleriaceae bacterium]|nr:hypothetical protein [Kofleriaceae bacterium]